MLTNKWHMVNFAADEPPGGGAPAEQSEPTTLDNAGPDFEAWLEKQPQETRDLYATHVKGLKTALDAERGERRKLEKQQRDADEGKRKEQENAEAKRLEDEKKFQELADKHKAQADKATAERDALQQRLQEYQLRDSFRAEAEKLKLQFGSVQAADDAFKLADLTSVDVDEKGVRGMDRVLKALQESRPYLFQQPRQGGDSNAKQGLGSSTPATQNDEERKSALKSRYRM